jgi:DNA replication protein DnaC
MVDLPLKNTPKIIQAPDQGEYCGFCYDEGYTVSEGISITLFDNPAFIELQNRRACQHCNKGLRYLAGWQEANNCDCLIGWVYTTQTEQRPDGRMELVTILDNCPKCAFGKELSERIEWEIKERKQARLNKLMANSGISEDIMSKTFANFQPGENQELQKAKGLVRTAAENSQSIILMGNPGRGKTHLAAAYLNHWMGEQGKAGCFVSLVDLMSSLRRTIRATDGPDWDTLLDRYIQADLLVLDDLGQEKASEKVIEVVFTLLNSRINHRRTTVVTTNYSLKKLTEEVGYPASVCSRLAGFERIMWDAPDYRLKNRTALKVLDPWQ